MSSLLTFPIVCAVVAFVCTAVKDTDQDRILRHSARLFGWIAGGIMAFSVVVHIATKGLGR